VIDRNSCAGVCSIHLKEGKEEIVEGGKLLYERVDEEEKISLLVMIKILMRHRSKPTMCCCKHSPTPPSPSGIIECDRYFFLKLDYKGFETETFKTHTKNHTIR